MVSFVLLAGSVYNDSLYLGNQEGGRASSGVKKTSHGSVIRSFLVITDISFLFVLLCSEGLFGRSFACLLVCCLSVCVFVCLCVCLFIVVCCVRQENRHKITCPHITNIGTPSCNRMCLSLWGLKPL